MTFLQLIYITIMPAIKFELTKIEQTVYETVELLENDILEKFCFFLALKKRIVDEKDAFLLSNLLEDIKCLSELNGLMEPIISNTRTLKRRIINKLLDDISFYPKDRCSIVHSSDVNLCEYVLAVLKGKGLTDYVIIQSFGEMIRRKIKVTAKKQSPEWPYIVLKRLLKC